MRFISALKYLTAAIFTFLFFAGFCQDNDLQYPVIPKKSVSSQDFVPNSWKIIDSAFGILSSSEIKNYVFVLQSKEPRKLSDSTCDSPEPFYPKMLIILAKNFKSKFYLLSAVGEKFFGHCNWGIQGSDPFDKIFIEHKSLAIQFFTGGTLRSQLTFYFQLVRGHWYLTKGMDYTYQQGQPGARVEEIDLIGNLKHIYSIDEKHKRTQFKKIRISYKLEDTLETFNGDFKYFTPERQ